MEWIKKMFAHSPKYSAVFMGMEGAGKTSLIHFLRTGKYYLDIQYTEKDKGFNVAHAHLGDCDVTLFEIAGRADYHLRCKGWEQFCWNKNVIVFAVECSSDTRDMMIAGKIIRWLSTRMALSDIPILVVGTKNEMRRSRTPRELWRDLGIGGIPAERRDLVLCTTVSCEDNVGMKDLMQKLLDCAQACKQARQDRLQSKKKKSRIGKWLTTRRLRFSKWRKSRSSAKKDHRRQHQRSRSDSVVSVEQRRTSSELFPDQQRNVAVDDSEVARSRDLDLVHPSSNTARASVNDKPIVDVMTMRRTIRDDGGDGEGGGELEADPRAPSKHELTPTPTLPRTATTMRTGAPVRIRGRPNQRAAPSTAMLERTKTEVSEDALLPGGSSKAGNARSSNLRRAEARHTSTNGMTMVADGNGDSWSPDQRTGRSTPERVAVVVPQHTGRSTVYDYSESGDAPVIQSAAASRDHVSVSQQKNKGVTTARMSAVPVAKKQSWFQKLRGSNVH
eukprot:ANDGO_02669.mRNA.1 ADP-ribosylation factor-like protein 8